MRIVDFPTDGTIEAHRKDIIDNFPAHTKPTIDRLRRADRDLRGKREARSTERTREIERQDELVRALGMLDREVAHAPKTEPSHTEERSRLVSEIGNCKARITALDAEAKEEIPTFSFASVEKWADAQPRFQRYRAKLLEPAPVIDPFDSLVEVRDKLHALSADLKAIEKLPVTAAEARDHAVAEIESLAAKGKIGVGGLLRLQPSGFENRPPKLGKLRFPRMDLHVAATVVQVTDTLALFAFLHKKAMIAAVEAELKLQNFDDAVSIVDRPIRIAAIQAEIRELERQEEALVLACERDRIRVSRRPNASVLAVLQIEPDRIAKPVPPPLLAPQIVGDASGTHHVKV